MKQPLVEQITMDEYLDILRKKWVLFCKRNKDKMEPSDCNKTSELLKKQTEYSGLFHPLLITWEGKQYLFLRIIPEGFKSNQQKKDFVEEVKYLRDIDNRFYDNSALNLMQFMGDYKPNKAEKMPLMQIFIL